MNMDDAAAYREAPGVLSETSRHGPDVSPFPVPVRRVPIVNVVLFFLTLLTTTMAGAYSAGADLSFLHPFATAKGLMMGLSFSIPLMAILLSHEMGHYLTARRNSVDASLPYFIPAPFPSYMIIGTFGAFIRLRAMPRSRRVMFDVGAAGPWAGVLVAIPVVILGLKLSEVAPLSSQTGVSLNLGNSLLFWGIARWILGVDPNLVSVSLHPMAFAGWIGLFVTTLNLLPVGQLDGGHVVYALFPRLHRTISTLFVASCVLMVVVPYVLGYGFWLGWLLWAALAIGLGLGHPSTVDRDTPLDLRRRIAAWMTVVLFAVTFIPIPISFSASPDTPPTPESQTYSVRYQVPAHRAPSRGLTRPRI
ncbi:MAG: site-2 protease family protein [Candidatus Binataceae bacterium]